MVEILRAEWQKMIGNRWAIGPLVGIFPVGAAALVGLMSLFALLIPSARNNVSPQLWTDTFMFPWAFANNSFGRAFLLGFTAVAFAGEYQWGTWKNIVTRQQRFLLIMAKFINLSALFFGAFILTSIILGFGYGLLSSIAGITYGPKVTGEIIQEFLGDYTLQAGLAFISVTISSLYAALSAIVMRSILGSVMVGVTISVFDPLVFSFSFWLARMSDWAFFLHLGRISPFYNIENITSWARDNQAIDWFKASYQMFDPTAVVPVDSVGFSILVLMGWIILGVGLVLYLFQQQDITT